MRVSMKARFRVHKVFTIPGRKWLCAAGEILSGTVNIGMMAHGRSNGAESFAERVHGLEITNPGSNVALAFRFEGESQADTWKSWLRSGVELELS